MLTTFKESDETLNRSQHTYSGKKIFAILTRMGLQFKSTLCDLYATKDDKYSKYIEIIHILLKHLSSAPNIFIERIKIRKSFQGENESIHHSIAARIKRLFFNTVFIKKLEKYKHVP